MEKKNNLPIENYTVRMTNNTKYVDMKNVNNPTVWKIDELSTKPRRLIDTR